MPNDYNVYRLDRSLQSHPIDPLNPNKFRRNGGGVLIAVNNKLTLQSKLIPVKCAAELLAVELTLPDCTKIIISTCYRVGTLGISNCKEIMNNFNKLSRKKMLRKFVVIGDFNLKNVNWNAGNGINSTSSLENEFLNGFADLGLLHCIDAPTHNKGKTLDILLTKSKQYITDLKVIDTERYCISDHFAVTFKISQTVTRKPRVKQTCFNYEKANWNDLNNDLNNINWDITLDCQEPDIMWSNFKNAVLDKVNAHIPKFTIKSEYQPPWFDSEYQPPWFDSEYQPPWFDSEYQPPWFDSEYQPPWFDSEYQPPWFDSEYQPPWFDSEYQPPWFDSEYQQPWFDSEYQPPWFDSEYQPPWFDSEYQPPWFDSEYQPPWFDSEYQPPWFDSEYQPPWFVSEYQPPWFDRIPTTLV